MAITHKTVGTEITQAEFEASDSHTGQPTSISDFLDDTAGGTDALTTKAPTSNAFYDVAHALPNRNAIINGAMDIWQRGVGPLTSATVPLNSDDTFVSDRWILLSEGNDIVDVSQTAVDTDKDSPVYSMTLDVETANKQFGICQILELKDSKRLIGQTVSLSFKAKVSNTRSSGSLCAAVLSCVDTGKDDTVISDVVKTWNGGGVEPTWYDTAGSIWTREGTVGSFTPTTGWVTYKLEGVAIDTAASTNVAVIIWNDDSTTTAGDFLYISQVQLELGSVATPFEFRPFQQELALCQRYYYLHVSGNALMVGQAAYYLTTMCVCAIFFPVAMRIAPTLYQATGGTGLYSLSSAGAGDALDDFLIDAPTTTMTNIYNATDASGTAGYAGNIQTASASAWLAFGCEL